MADVVKLPWSTNRKPADELGVIRREIQALEMREQILREKMIAGECDLEGDEYRVSISKSRREKIDTAKIKRELGLVFLRPFIVDTEQVTVRTIVREGK